MPGFTGLILKSDDPKTSEVFIKMSSGVEMYIFSTMNNCVDYKVVSVDEFDEWTF